MSFDYDKMVFPNNAEGSPIYAGELDCEKVALHVALAAGTVSYLWTGSTYIEGRGKDVDIVLNPPYMDAESLSITTARLIASGYTHTNPGTDKYPESATLRTFRKGVVNVILSMLPVERWRAARDFCCWLSGTGVKGKDVRIITHAIVVDGKSMGEAHAAASPV